MEEVLNCFGNVIGTTRDTDSDSGLYITDLEALSTLQGLVGTEDWGDIEELLDNAKRIAILNLNTDLTALIMRFSKQKRAFKGLIGSNKYTKLKAETGKSGIRLLCTPIEHGEINIKSIGALFTQTGTIDLYLASNYSDEVSMLTIDTLANKVKWTSDFGDVEMSALPMKHESVRYVEYYLYHENPYNFLDNKVVCSSCRGFYFDSYRPRFKNYGHESWLMVGGFNSEVEDVGNHATNLMKGLILNVDIKCRIDRIICDEALDFSTNPMAQSFALAAQHKAGSVVLWNIIRSSKLNRVLMQDIETFREAATYYERRYNGMIKNIASTIPVNGCLCEKGFTDAWIR